MRLPVLIMHACACSEHGCDGRLRHFERCAVDVLFVDLPSHLYGLMQVRVDLVSDFAGKAEEVETFALAYGRCATIHW